LAETLTTRLLAPHAARSRNEVGSLGGRGNGRYESSDQRSPPIDQHLLATINPGEDFGQVVLDMAYCRRLHVRHFDARIAWCQFMLGFLIIEVATTRFG